MTAIRPTLTVTSDTKLTDKQAIARYTQLHPHELTGKRAIITNIIENGDLRTYEFDLRPTASHHGRHEELLKETTTQAVTVAPKEEPKDAKPPAPEPPKPERRRGGVGKTRGTYKVVVPKGQKPDKDLKQSVEGE
jgi:hypothetical protein